MINIIIQTHGEHSTNALMHPTPSISLISISHISVTMENKLTGPVAYVTYLMVAMAHQRRSARPTRSNHPSAADDNAKYNVKVHM
jgi:hypothetical protein